MSRVRTCGISSFSRSSHGTAPPMRPIAFCGIIHALAIPSGLAPTSTP